MKIRTRACIAIFLGYILFKIVCFVVNSLSQQEHYEPKAVRQQNTDKDKMEMIALEQQRRVDHIRTVCQYWEKKVTGSPGPLWLEDRSGRSHLAFGNEVWRSSEPRFDQELQISSHLVHRGQSNISYCWIHKGEVNHLFPYNRFSGLRFTLNLFYNFNEFLND